MCDVASLDVDEEADLSLGLLQYDLNNFKRGKWKGLYFWGVLGALLGAPGVIDVRCCLPECR